MPEAPIPAHIVRQAALAAKECGFPLRVYMDPFGSWAVSAAVRRVPIPGSPTFEHFPGERWTALVSPARLARARELQAERERRDQGCDLVDCLQLGDKAQVLLTDPHQLEELGFSSRKAAKKVVKELESLRNNLAHAQDIVTHDWPQIARMTRNLQADALED